MKKALSFCQDVNEDYCFITDSNFDEPTGQVLLMKIWTQAFKLGAAVALWRLPGDKAFHLLVDLSGKPEPVKTGFPVSKEGFVISPFLESTSKETLFLAADAVFAFEGNCCFYKGSEAFNLLNASLLEGEAVFGKAKDNFITPLHYRAVNAVIIPTSELAYTNLVKKSLISIKQGYFSKVVLAQQQKVNLGQRFDAVSCFMRLKAKCPTAFVSLVSVVDFGTWLGASPELLIQSNFNEIRTVALAATRNLKQSTALSPSMFWSEKELREQAMVSHYIEQVFDELDLDFTASGPSTVQAANVSHLKTEYTATFDARKKAYYPWHLVEQLHPTPAVCGTPKQVALDFICQYEAMDRGCYCGYLGPVNFSSSIHLYVNLRCMEIHKDCACLFAGAGITADSNPYCEWLETTLKCQTLLSVLEG